MQCDDILDTKSIATVLRVPLFTAKDKRFYDENEMMVIMMIRWFLCLRRLRLHRFHLLLLSLLGLLLVLNSVVSAQTTTVNVNVCEDIDGEDRVPPYCVGVALPCEELDSIDCTSTEGCVVEGFLGFFGPCSGEVTSSCRQREYGVDCALLTGCENYVVLPCDMDLYRDCPICQQQEETEAATTTTVAPVVALPAPAPDTISTPATTPANNNPEAEVDPSTTGTTSATPLFKAASSTNFCYNLDGNNPPYCYGTAKDCNELDIIACDNTPGCSSSDQSFMGLANSLSSGNAQCSGTVSQTCYELDYGPTCEYLTGCKSDYDPPCVYDPFDIAILPLNENTLLCGAQSDNRGNVVQGGCVKTRPSADGEVTIYMEVGASSSGSSYSRCVMTIDDKDCDYCRLCGSGGLEASFNCANVLSLDHVDGDDDRCSDGSSSRCVGRDCNGNCICGKASSSTSSSGGSSSSHCLSLGLFMLAIIPLVAVLLFV